jgi:hypothetical protein
MISNCFQTDRKRISNKIIKSAYCFYSSYYNTQSGEIYQIANNALELQQIFDQNKRTGSRLIYRPISNSSISDINDYPIFGYFSFQRKQYNSIIQHSCNSLLFKPKNCVISF